MSESKTFSASLTLGTLNRIEVSGFDGKVDITPADSLSISAVIHGIEGMNPKDLEKAQIKVEINGDALLITPAYGFKLPGVGKHPLADLTLAMPPTVPLAVRTSGGYTTIKGLTGAVEIDLNGGELVADALAGTLDVSVRVGKARLADCTGVLNVTMWGGELLIARQNPWATGQSLAVGGPGGQITIEAPDGSSLTFEATSMLGGVESDLNWDKSETKGGVGSYFKGVMGAGAASIKINSGKTKVVLRRPTL